jgi:DNA cross-link repair 1A protein
MQRKRSAAARLPCLSAAVVGFRPTGWTQQTATDKTRTRGRRRQLQKTVIMYEVPYSEHSSFSELRAFVHWFNPGRIVPSVNGDDDGPKAQKLVQLLRGIY